MKVYVDYVLFLNFCFDFILLFGCGYILKRKIDINRLIIGSFIGSFTVLFLFFNLNNFALFFFKILIAIIMVIVSYKFCNFIFFIKNFFMFYILGLFLGGVMYALNLSFSSKSNGFIFYYDGVSINVLVILFLSIFVIFLYIKYLRNIKDNNLSYYNISFVLNGVNYDLVGFLDTGCKIVDPFFNRSIILVGKDVINFSFDKFIFVPYTTIDSEGLIKCVCVDFVNVSSVGICKNVLIGFLERNIGIDGVDCILQSSILEGN